MRVSSYFVPVNEKGEPLTGLDLERYTRIVEAVDLVMTHGYIANPDLFAAIRNVLVTAAQHPQEHTAQALLCQIVEHSCLTRLEKDLRLSIIKENAK